MVGGQYRDNMTPAKAARIRSQRIEGRRLSRREIRDQQAAIKDAEAGRWTIARLWKEYYSGKPVTKGLSTDAGRFEKYIKPAFGDKIPQELLPLDVDRLRLRIAKTLAPQTVAHVLRLLKRIVNFGLQKQLCPPMNFKVQIPHVNNLRTEFLTPDQLKRLIGAMNSDPNQQAARFMKMALYTGMRRGELFKLRWQDVDFERGFILIREPKGGQDQIIPLNDQARAVLEQQRLGGGGASDYIFPGKGGNQAVDFRRGINRIRKRAGLPKDFRPMHGLRHHFASALASSGQVDLYTLQRLLTHKSPEMTQRYAHLRDDTLKRASELAGHILNLEPVAKIRDAQ
ncbi:tyrosine-type recombinase/integrase [Gemmatimonadota bacterium]